MQFVKIVVISKNFNKGGVYVQEHKGCGFAPTTPVFSKMQIIWYGLSND